ncbi:MAG: VWA-like domain-containing protein [Bacillota bacterium]
MARVKEPARAVREDLAGIRALTLLRAPFLGLLLGRMRILLNGKIDTICATTAGEVIVNPFFWEGLPDIEARTFVLLHEALHLGFRHPWLARGRNRALYNLAADMVVNEMLFRHGYTAAPPPAVTAEVVHGLLRAQGVRVELEEVRRASVEEIYRLLTSAAARAARAPEEGKTGDLRELERDREGEVVQEGGCGAGERPERYWEAAVSRALVAAREAGLLPADLARQAEVSLRPRVDWRRALRACLQEGVGRSVVGTWQRPSRRYPVLPGVKRLGVRSVWALVDCSGSIGEELLGRFLSEIHALARHHGCLLHVLPWDARAYPPVRALSPAQVRAAARGLRGGGGTVLRPALEALLGKMRPADIVVVFSDGHIADLQDAATLALYRRVAARAAQTLFVTAGRAPRLPRTPVISI